MGFGILFFGYFVMFAFSISQMYFFADIIGAVISIFAFSKLSEYNKYYKKAMVAALVFAGFCMVNAASMMFHVYPSTGTADTVVDILKAAASAIMHVFIFLGARGLSLGAGAEKLVKNSERNLKLTSVYYASYIIISIIRPYIGEAVDYFNMLLLVLWLVCLIVNLVFIYKCYAVLCPADEDEKEVKRSRFAIINKINDKMDEFEQNNKNYRLESMRLAQEEAQRLAKEKEKKKKHGKKKKK